MELIDLEYINKFFNPINVTFGVNDLFRNVIRFQKDGVQNEFVFEDPRRSFIYEEDYSGIDLQAIVTLDIIKRINFLLQINK